MSDNLTAAEWDTLNSKTFCCQLGLGDFEKRNVMVSAKKSSDSLERLMFVIDPDPSLKFKVSFVYYLADGCYFDPARLVFLFESRMEQRIRSRDLIMFMHRKKNLDFITAKTLLKGKELRVLFDSDGINVEFLPLFMRALGWKGAPLSHEMSYKAFPDDVRKPFNPLLMKSEDQKLYPDGMSTDFVLVSSDNRKIKVHRVKIAAVSEVFRNMLSHETVEKREGICRIADIDYETLKLMVDAFYGLSVEEERMEENCGNLYIAANKYQLSELQTSCSQYMEDNMAITNVVEMFQVGKECGDEEFVKTAVRFVRSNYEAFIDSDGFIEVVEKIPEYSREFFKLVSVNLVEKK